jgi:hypothetical protein
MVVVGKPLSYSKCLSKVYCATFPIIASKLELTHLYDSVFSKGIFPEVCLHLNAVVKEFRLSTGES